jgi:ABC-type branched-subunit amino acid transport system ATPase component
VTVTTSAAVDLTVDRVSVAFGGLKALSDVEFTVRRGLVTSLIGPNGAGKTTLFGVISGFIAPNGGTVSFRGRKLNGIPAHRIVRLGIVRTFQDLRLFARMTTLENILAGIPNNLDDLPRSLASRRMMLRPSAIETAREAMQLLDIEQYADELASNLSYGLQKRCAIARAIATGADVFLLDEPMAGLQPSMVTQLMDIIKKLVASGKTIVLIDHNMEAVMDASDWVVVLDHGRKIAEGLPKTIRENEQVLSVYLGVA